MTDNRKLVIKTPIESPRTDPLSRFYFYKGTDGIGDDPLVLSYATDEGTCIRWSLGGWSSSDPVTATPLVPSPASADFWRRSTEATTTDDGNPFVAPHDAGKIKPLKAAFEKLKKHSQMTIINSDQVEAWLSDIETPFARIDAPDEYTKFVQKLRALANGSFYVNASNAILTDSADDLGMLLRQLRTFLAEDDRDINISALYQSIAAVLTRQQLFQAVQMSASETYEALRVTITTPFITRLSTHEALGQTAQTAGTAEIDPEYNSYHKLYEDTLTDYALPANLHPNMYTFGLYSEASDDDEGFRVSNAWTAQPDLSNMLQTQYEQVVTLNGKIPSNTLGSQMTSFREYIRSFSRGIKHWYTTGQQDLVSPDAARFILNTKMSKLIIPASETEILSEFTDLKRRFPMYIETSFTTPAAGSMTSLFLEEKCGSTILDYCQQNQENKETFDIESDSVGPSSINISPGGQQQPPDHHSVINITAAPLTVNSLKDATTPAAITALVLSRRGEEPVTTAALTDIQIQSLETAYQATRLFADSNKMSYLDYSAGTASNPSDVLGYKISKYDSDNSLLQEISIGNTSRAEAVAYIDTQVGYDTEYRYELHEHRLVVSTKYQLFVIDSPPLAPPNNPPPRLRGYTPDQSNPGIGIRPRSSEVYTPTDPRNMPRGRLRLSEQSNPGIGIRPRSSEVYTPTDPRNMPSWLTPIRPGGIFTPPTAVSRDWNIPVSEDQVGVSPHNSLRPEGTQLSGEIPDGISETVPNALYAPSLPPSIYTPLPIPTEPVIFELYAIETPVLKIIDVPIYGSVFAAGFSNDLASRCVRYPKVKVLDHPPSPPDLQILPILNNDREAKILVHPGAADFIGERSRRAVLFPGYDEILNKLMSYQKNFENYTLPPRHLEYRNEDVREIRTVKVYRIDDILRNPSDPIDLYSSFSGLLGNEVAIATLSLEPGDDYVPSFDMIDDTLVPNKYYYYTCIAEDAHGNPSLPSPIYRVRLVSDKGVYYPEIELYQPPMVPRHAPTKKFSRFIQIQASDIQSFPHTEDLPDGTYRSIKNLASQLGSSIIDGDFVIRFTSRDTGRKMDLKLTFSEKQNLIEDENLADGE